MINHYKEGVEHVLKRVRDDNDKATEGRIARPRVSTVPACKRRISSLEMLSKNCQPSNGTKLIVS